MKMWVCVYSYARCVVDVIICEDMEVFLAIIAKRFGRLGEIYAKYLKKGNLWTISSIEDQNELDEIFDRDEKELTIFEQEVVSVDAAVEELA